MSKPHLNGMKRDLTGKYCPKLFTFFEVSVDGDCWLCCPAWLPYKLGNILTDDFDDIWNGEVAQQLRAQVFENKWDFCNHALCPQIQSGHLPQLANKEATRKNQTITRTVQQAIEQGNTRVDDLPTIINLSEDQSCNLRCPSCRVSKIMHHPGTPAYEKAKQINDRIYDVFFGTPTNRRFKITCTGSGDPFASKIYRDFLRRIDGSKFPNLKVDLLTNGVMFTPKMWKSLEHIHNQLGDCRISLDAGTKYTYENHTRLGGDWDLLLENCDYLNERTAEFLNFKIHFDFVVQACNFEEMATYAELVLDRYPNATSCHFSKLHDWQTWNRKDYLERAVWMPDHPRYNEMLEHLKNPVFDNPRVFLGNLTAYRNV